MSSSWRAVLWAVSISSLVSMLEGCSGSPSPICQSSNESGLGSDVQPCSTGGVSSGGTTAAETTGGTGPSAGGVTSNTSVGGAGATNVTGGADTGGYSPTGGISATAGAVGTDTGHQGGVSSGGADTGNAAGMSMGGASLCGPGSADCDGNSANGCEVNLNSDPSNCGSCGYRCTIRNGTPSCLSGKCGILRCTPGFSDCNDIANDGCEVNVGTMGCLADSVYTLTVSNEACTSFCATIGGTPTFTCEEGNPFMDVTVGKQSAGNWRASLTWPLGLTDSISFPLLEAAQSFIGEVYPDSTASFCGGNTFSSTHLRFSIDCTGTGTASVYGSSMWEMPNGCPNDCRVNLSGSGTVSSGGATKSGCADVPDGGSTGDAGTQELPALGPSPISGGEMHTCAVLPDGTVHCWGDNTYGQLGVAGITLSTLPVAVTGLSQVQNVSASSYAHTCALISDGTVQCWGDNYYGELGNGTTANSAAAVSVVGLTQAMAVSAGAGFSCVVLQNGNVTCWGYNYKGQLGNGGTTSSTTPVTVQGISGAIGIASGNAHACAVVGDGSVLCWGDNFNGQLGNGSYTVDPNPVPQPVVGLSNAIAITAGEYHTCALHRDNSVSCWGNNSSKQLGNGTGTSSYVPVSVLNISRVVAVSSGAAHTCALVEGGPVQCWGSNNWGQLGNGTTTSSYVPTATSLSLPAIALSAGFLHTCVLLQDGSARCWGRNTYGQIGDGTTTTATLPVAVRGIP